MGKDDGSDSAGEPPEDAAQTRLHLAYAEASVMLLEGLMFLLVEKGIVSMDSLIETIETVIATKQAQIKESGHPLTAAIASGVLSRLANSVNAIERR